MKTRNRGSRLFYVIVFIVFVGIISFFTYFHRYLGNDFDRDTVIEHGEEVVDLLNSCHANNDYSELIRLASNKYKKKLKEGKLDSINDDLNNLGVFQRIVRFEVAGSRNRNKKGDAVVMLKAKYTKKKAIFYLEFNPKYELEDIDIRI